MAGWLFGGLLGGGEQDCSTADARSDRTMAEIQQQWPLRPSLDPVMVVVQEVGRHLGRDTDPQGGRQWQFAVLRNLEPIAYSIGGGRFIVSDGLVAMVRDESQLAAVLAHEIAHQQLNHFCRRTRQDAERIDLGGVIQNFDLEAEIEADTRAVGILTASGFDPHAMESVLRCLMQSTGGNAPDLAQRLDALRDLAIPPLSSKRRDSADFRGARTILREEFGDQTPAATRCR